MNPGHAAWITAVTSLIAAALSALLTHLYRNRRDRAVLSANVETFKVFRHSIPIPANLYSQVRPEGSFNEWAKDIVKWDVVDRIDRNAFELHELRDLRALCPRFVERQDDRITDYKSMLASLRNVDPKNLTAEQKDTLSRIRHYWIETYKQDIFVLLSKNPDEVLEEIRLNLQGDIAQSERSVQNIKRLGEWLDKGLSADASAADRISPAPKSPDNPQDPYICIEVLARNSGRSETLIKDTAVLAVGEQSLPLKGITGKYGFELYTGKYWRVKPTSIEELRFSQHPREANLKQLQDLKGLIADRRHKATITLYDYLGNPLTTPEFDIREDGDDD